MRLTTLPVLLLLAAPLNAQCVDTAGGNVVYRAGASAVVHRLTASGHDSEPRLSPDGRQVAFVRATSATERGDGGVSSSIWIVGIDGSGLRELVRARADTAPERNLGALRGPVYSPDGARVYFLSSAWATSGAVHVADVTTGAERYLMPGNSVDVLPAGRYAGHLMVNQHRYFLGSGSYDWTWLFTPQGSEVGPIGETEEAVQEFREEEGGGMPSGCP